MKQPVLRLGVLIFAVALVSSVLTSPGYCQANDFSDFQLPDLPQPELPGDVQPEPQKNLEKINSNDAAKTAKPTGGKKTGGRTARPNPFDSPNFVKTPEELKSEFAAIRKMKIAYSGSIPAVPRSIVSVMNNTQSQQRSKAELQNLMAYRAVVGVPYHDMTLDKTQTSHATAGAMLLAFLGKLDHTPQKPNNYPQDLYDWGYKGTSSGNLYMSATNSGITGSVMSFMNDSDPGNIKMLGHRRWCINPYMKTTGFGESGRWGVMWSFDQSRPHGEFSYDKIGFPACGLTPANMLQPDWAWNVSLNPEKYTYLGDEKLKITVTPAFFNAKTAALKKSNRPALNLDSVSVNQDGYAIPLCVIFRPNGVMLQPGAAYCVEIDGFADSTGTAQKILYWVVFCKPM